MRQPARMGAQRDENAANFKASKPLPQFFFVITSLVLLALLSTACGAEASPAPLAATTAPTVAATTSVPPSPTPLPPTLTPTATPIPDPFDHLLSANEEFLLSVDNPEMREMFGYPQFKKEYDLNGMHSYHIRWWMAGNFELAETITIAPQAWEQIPEGSFPGSERFEGNSAAIESPVIGDNSQVFEFENERGLRLVFSKGSALVNIYARGFSVENVVNLGKLVEARLPAEFQNLSPITFPEQLDQAAFDRYFTEVTLGQIDFAERKFTPTNIFPPAPFFWKYVTAPGAPDFWSERSAENAMWKTAVYDVQNQRYVYKMAAIWSVDGFMVEDVSYPSVFPYYPLSPGLYEFKLAVKGVLVASLPFEIRE